MITYIENRFGRDAITYLHNDADHSGLDSVQALLDSRGSRTSATDLVHQWTAMLALDGFQDDGAKLKGGSPSIYSASQLHAGIDWAWPGSYDSPGAPPNGSDYVQARRYERMLSAKGVNKITFKGAPAYAPDPLQWTVDATAHDGGAALFSGSGNELDRAAVTSVTVPAANPTLTFSTKYNIESGWDFGVVQVSTDGGKTYTSLANDNTTTDHDADAAGNIVAQLPGLTGVSDWTTETFDLSKYAGKTILLSFRYMTDAAQEGNNADNSNAGWWVDDVNVGGTSVSDGSSLDAFKSATQVSPTPVAGWSVQLVGWDEKNKRVYYGNLPVHNGWASASKSTIRRILNDADHVGIIVTVDDPTETATKNATYELRVNGELQPGGR